MNRALEWRLPAALAAVCLAAFAQPVDGNALLRQARARIVDHLDKLPKYTCVQTIQRSRFEMFYGPRGNRCGEPARARPGQNRMQILLAWTDRFKLDVTVAGGEEIFSWAGARAFQSGDAQEIVGGGMTGNGDFGPFLMDIFGANGAEFQYTGVDRGLAAWGYRVPAVASHYQLKVGDRTGDTLAYEGQFWIDPRTAELERLTIVVPKPPPHAETCRIETEIEYQPVSIGGAPLVLPQTTLLKLWDTDGSRYENRIAYQGCRAFQSESVFRTDVEGAPAESPAPATAMQATPRIPAGLDVHIDLHSPIDMENAWAGDAIEGRLEEAIGSLVPPGAVVRGRIVRAERHFVPTSYFTLGLRFYALVVRGVEVPLSLDSVARSREAQMLTDSQKAPGVGMFVFHGDPRTIEEGFRTAWRTK